MTQHQHRLGFDDPDSLTRDGQLSVVRARGEGVEPFDTSLFAGFDSMKALTYTASIPMIVGLLRDFDYADFECIFGHQGILRPEITDIFGFQNTVDEKLNKAFVAVETSDERRQALFDSVAKNRARFFVVKDRIAHAKIYLLERDDLRRVVVGSANLSETAFSGRQAETPRAVRQRRYRVGSLQDAVRGGPQRRRQSNGAARQGDPGGAHTDRRDAGVQGGGGEPAGRAHLRSRRERAGSRGIAAEGVGDRRKGGGVHSADLWPRCDPTETGTFP